MDGYRVSDNAKDYQNRITELTGKQKRARKVSREWYGEQVERLRAEYTRYCEAFGVAFELLTGA